MRQVQPEELSALLDGELSPERAAEVRARIAAEPALQADYAALASLDGWARAAAGAEAFAPAVRLPARADGWGWAASVLLALLLVRFVPKIAALATPGLWLQLAACGAVLIAIARLAGERAVSPGRAGRGGAARGGADRSSA